METCCNLWGLHPSGMLSRKLMTVLYEQVTPFAAFMRQRIRRGKAGATATHDYHFLIRNHVATLELTGRKSGIMTAPNLPGNRFPSRCDQPSVDSRPNRQTTTATA